MNIIEFSRYDEPGPDIFSELLLREHLNEDTRDSEYLIVAGESDLERILDSSCKRPESAVVDISLLESPEIVELLNRCGDIPVYTANLAVTGLNETYYPEPNIFTLFRKPELKSPEELCKNARRICVMERALVPNNMFGAIRNGISLGIDAVLLTHDCNDIQARRGVRDFGAVLFRDVWTILPPVDDLVGYLHGLGFKTVGMTLSEDSVTPKDPGLRSEERLAIIMGNEHDGLKRETEINCDYKVFIPINRSIDSLNVSKAATIAFYELGKVDDE